MGSRVSCVSVRITWDHTDDCYSCERENRWLDEADYGVDTALIPRGGHRRRKSMEPRMLTNVNGHLVPAETPPRAVFEMSPTKEFLNLSSAASRRESIIIPPPAVETPEPAEQLFEDGESSWGSPTTPYFLSRGAQLLQQTCPPKQTQQLLFPVSGEIEDQPDESTRHKLLLARRKSLQWVPKVGSPLGRAVSYGRQY